MLSDQLHDDKFPSPSGDSLPADLENGEPVYMPPTVFPSPSGDSLPADAMNGTPLGATGQVSIALRRFPSCRPDQTVDRDLVPIRFHRPQAIPFLPTCSRNYHSAFQAEQFPSPSGDSLPADGCTLSKPDWHFYVSIALRRFPSCRRSSDFVSAVISLPGFHRPQAIPFLPTRTTKASLKPV